MTPQTEPSSIVAVHVALTIGSFLTMFRVRRHANEFLSKVNLATVETAQASSDASSDSPDDTADDDDTATASVAKQAEVSTSDFVIKSLMTELTGH
jgi:restriction system protein